MINKINLTPYPIGNFQTVYTAEGETALELAGITAKKVNECVDIVNGVDALATQAQQVVQEMQLEQADFITANNDARTQLIADNEAYIAQLEASTETITNNATNGINTFNTNSAQALAQFTTDKANALTDFDTAGDTALSQFTTDKNNALTTFDTAGDTALSQFTTDKTQALADFTTSSNNAISTFNTNGTTAINNISTQVETEVETQVNTKISDGTIGDLINDTLLGDINTSITNINKKVNSEVVKPEDFDAKGDGVTDDTTAIQNAIAYAYANKKALKLCNKYKVTKITLNQIFDFTIISEGAKLIGATSGIYTCLLDINDCQSINMIGKLTIDCKYNRDYGCGIWIHDTSRGSCDFHMFEGITVLCAKVAWRIGDITRPDSAISEIVINKFSSYGCPAIFEVIGSQAIANITNSFLYCDGSGWTGGYLEKYAVRCIGSLVRVDMCDVMMLTDTNESTFILQPIPSVTYGNPFGSIYCTNTLIETASRLALVYNPAVINNPTIGTLKFDNCMGYHSQNLADFIYADLGYKGDIIVDKCNFFGGVPRSYYNIRAITDECNVYVNDTSFGKNFKQGLSGVIGGTLHFSPREILNVYNANNQAITSNVNNTVTFINVQNESDLLRFSANYNVSTGEFTVPVGGLKNVQISVSLYVGDAITSADLMIYVDGIADKIERISVTGSTSRHYLYLNGGTKIKVVVKPIGVSGILDAPYYLSLIHI